MSPIPASAGARTVTVQDTLHAARARLKKARIAEADIKCEWLLANLLDCNRSTLDLRGREPFPDGCVRILERSLRRLVRHEPLQYVLGNEFFFGRPFACDARALIPRPETEALVALVMTCAPLWRRRHPRIAEAGTGTGCIAITLALEMPSARLIATDSDPQALVLARKNARRHRVAHRIRFLQTDLLTGLSPGSLDAVLSNPPYVNTGEWARLERQIRLHEPRQALDGGADGLDLIRRLTDQTRRVLRRGGVFLLEIGNDQESDVRRILRDTGFGRIVCHKDLQGHPRSFTAHLRG